MTPTDPIIIPDNCQGMSWETPPTDQQRADLGIVANKTIQELCGDNDAPSLLVFPSILGVKGDIETEDSLLRIHDDKLYAGNLMGFIGCNDTRLKIRSRFDKNENDYFVHYMLERVFSINLFDLPYQTEQQSVFVFALFLFPFFLKKALSQGIYKEYFTYKKNDSNVRGAIDVSRHIRHNVPFTGNIAYNVREHALDNPLLELIRHTIEHIREKEYGSRILSCDDEMRSFVACILGATPNYSKGERLRIIVKNLRSKVHPYFSEYEPLRKLCIQILRQEGIKYGEENDKIYGVIFDGAWLWEAYLETILTSEGFTHSENRMKLGGLSMFATPGEEETFNRQSQHMYPDFYRKNHILDAKYKQLNQGVRKEDLYQVVTYMHCTNSQHGSYVYPFKERVQPTLYKLNGLGGSMMVYPFYVPQNITRWDTFTTEIADSEKRLREQLRKSV